MSLRFPMAYTCRDTLARHPRTSRPIPSTKKDLSLTSRKAAVPSATGQSSEYDEIMNCGTCGKTLRSDNRSGFCNDHRVRVPRTPEQVAEYRARDGIAQRIKERDAVRLADPAKAQRKREVRLASYYRNQAHISTYHAERRKENPDAYLPGEHERRRVRLARISSTKITSEPIRRQDIFDRDGGVCHLCNLPVDPTNWHMDHVIPISRGGHHTADNVRTSHPLCNLRKGSKLS